MTEPSSNAIRQLEQAIAASREVADLSETPGVYNVGDRSQSSVKISQLPTIWTPRPLRVTHPVLASENELLAACINHFVNFTYPPELGGETVLEHCFAVTRQIVCGQFIRQVLDRDFRDWRMPRHWGRSVKDQLNAHAALMVQIWRSIKLLSLPPNPRPLVFQAINLERALIFFDFIHREEDDTAPATTIIRNQQGVNRDLQSLTNPFEPSSSPQTWSFIEECRQAADRSDDFRSDYMRLIQARMTLLSEIRKNHPKLLDQFGKTGEKRGRKSISLSRSIT